MSGCLGSELMILFQGTGFNKLISLNFFLEVSQTKRKEDKTNHNQHPSTELARSEGRITIINDKEANSIKDQQARKQVAPGDLNLDAESTC